MPVPTSETKGRVGLREIADAAGVCLMTVSLSLRDSPKISDGTRQRIHRIAGELGYRPDPELARLMKHLRASRTSRGSTGIAILDFYPSVGFTENVYNRNIREGFVRRATELGMSVSTLHGADYRLNLAGMLKVVRSRGIDGVVLMPSPTPMALDASADWRGLSVVSSSNSILAPRFHYIVPNQFGNTMRMIEHVQADGCRRVCGIFDESFDERTGHNFTAALKWHGHGQRILVVPQTLPESERATLVTRWISKHRPDAVFTQCDAVIDMIRRLNGSRKQPKFQMIGLGEHNSGGFSFLNERADLIGTAAVDLLAGMMYYHETGIPTHPRTVLIDGEFSFVPVRAGKDPGKSVAAG